MSGTPKGDTNPIKSDPELSALVKRLDKVKKYKTFQRWKDGFLGRLETFLFDDGMKPAEKAGNDFDTNLAKFIKQATKVQDHIAKGELSDTKKTVKASLALNEMCNKLTNLVEEIELLIPFKKDEEKKKRFTKFHLGAVLIRQNFKQYAKMQLIGDALLEIGEKVENVADKQQHELMEMYRKQVQRFCDVMADLNLYEIMMKCIEFQDPPDEEESSDEEPISITIKVLTDEGTTLTLMLNPSETIGAVKDAIADGCGIAPEKQVLKFNDAELNNNDKSLADNGIKDGDILTVEPFRIPITVNTHDGKTIKMMIDPSDYLSDIKRQLEGESGIPPWNQRLFMNGDELDNDMKTATDYGIKAGSVLDLEPKTIKVTVTDPDGNAHEIKLKPSDTLEDIQAKIEEETGMPAEKQLIKADGKELPSGGITVKAMGIKDGADLTVEPRKVPVTVNTYDGKQIKVMVDPTEYMSDLKKMLEPESGVAARNQRLSKDGNELSDDMKQARDYGIEAGTVLDLEPKSITVSVETPDGNTVQVEVTPSDTTQNVKDKIEKATGIAAPRQVVKHKGTEMPDGSTVREAGIHDGDTLNVEIFKIPVKIKTMDGKEIKVMIDPTDKLGTIKKQLESESGLPADNQNLFMNGDELGDDNKTANDYGIKADTELDLEPKSIKVNVQTPDGQTHEVEIKPSDSTEQVKDKIADKTGIIAPRQVVKFQGEQLPDGKKVRDMGISEGDTLNVEIFKVPVTVNTHTGKTIQVMVDPTDTLGAIKKDLEEESGLAAEDQAISKEGTLLGDDNKSAADYGIEGGSVLDLEPRDIHITVETPDGEQHALAIKPTDTKEQVQEKIASKTGIAVPRQVVTFNGNPLPEDQVVKGMGIKDGDSLKVEIFKVPVTVNTYDGKIIEVMVDPTDTLGAIKKDLEAESGLSPDNQVLHMNGEVLPDDDKTAAEYGIEGGSVLDLEPKSIKLTVKTPDGETHAIEVSPKDTTEQIKDKIAAATGITVPRQVVKFNGDPIPDGSTVKDLGIQDGDTLEVEIFKVPVTVNTYDGKTIEVMVDPTDTLGAIKKDLEAESGLSPDNQELHMNGEVLPDDEKTAAEYGIEGGSVLDLEPKSIKLAIKTPDGKTHAIDVSPKDTTEQVKDKIAGATGITVPRQVVKFNGDPIPDGSTVKELGIQDGDTLEVEIYKVPVTVNTYDGKTIEVMVDPTDTLGAIKKDLEAESGLSPDNQELHMNGEVLPDDEKTAAEYGIEGGSVLDLEPKSIQVTVETPDGKTHTVAISPKDTTEQVKDKIAAATGITVPRQVVKFNGEPMADGKTVKELGIQDGDNLQVEIYKVPVTVNTYDGKTIEVMVDPTDTLGAIKKDLEAESGLAPENQVLHMNGEVLPDDAKTAAEYGIEGGSVLDLEPKSMKVTVETPDGKTHTIDVSPKDTTEQVKDKIAAKSGIASPRQVVKFNGEPMADGKTVKDLGIQDGDNLQVEIFKVPVTVNTYDGKTIEVMVDPTDTLGAIKKDLEAESGLAPENQVLHMKGEVLPDDNKTAAEYGIEGGSVLDLEPKSMQVTVETPDGKTHTIDVSPKDTTEQVKDKIAAKSGIASPRQVVKFNGEPMADGKTVKDLGIQDGDSLQVEIFKVPVTVNTYDGKTIEIMVDPTNSLGGIKKDLEAESGLAADNQVLSKDGVELTDDSKSAADYGIVGGSVLDLEPKSIQVTIETPDGKTHAIDISPKDTTEDVKNKIAAKTGIDSPRQVVNFNGKPMPDGKTVKDLGIQEGDTLKVEIFKVPVTVETYDGKTINIMVDPTDKLLDIKKQLEDESGVTPNNQRIFKDGAELEDDNTIAKDYGIKGGTVLKLEPKIIQVTVETPDGKTHTVEVTPADTTEDVKSKIAAKTGIAVPRQVVKFNGKAMPDGKTVKDLGIRDGDNLKVEIFRVPVTVKTYDGKTIQTMVDPTDKLLDIKKQLEDESGVEASNQKLFMDGYELEHDDTTADEYGIEGGSVLQLEPKSMTVKVETPDGKTHQLAIRPRDNADEIKQKIANESGIAAPRQLVTHKGKPLDDEKMAMEMGIRDGDTLKVDYNTIPIIIKTYDDQTLKFNIEPTASIDSIKDMINDAIDLPPKKQLLKLGEEELRNGKARADQYGIVAGSTLKLELNEDPIIFVDIKCGTLFGLDREKVIEGEILKPNQGNKLDFLEAATDSATKDKIKKVMMESPTLGVNPQIVVRGLEVEDYDIAEKEEVKNKWGVQLKKRTKNKAGEEFIFIDSKTGACGELSRKKYLDSKFIIEVPDLKGGHTLEQREKDTMKYEQHILSIRGHFGIKSAT